MDDAAKAADVPKSTWQTWEAGSPPGATKAVRAARVLHTTVEAIWGETPLPTDDVAPEPREITVVRDPEYVQTRDSVTGAGV